MSDTTRLQWLSNVPSVLLSGWHLCLDGKARKICMNGTVVEVAPRSTSAGLTEAYTVRVDGFDAFPPSASVCEAFGRAEEAVDKNGGLCHPENPC